nr:S8 family serine peptidase [Bacteroidota bacterium]
MNEDDIDLQHRVLSTSQVPQGSNLHATTISTLAGGAGNSFVSGRGVASQCTFFSSSYSNLFADKNSVLLQNNVSVQNHSYGTIIQSFYGAEALSYDLQTAQNKNLLHVFSCGNKGLDTSSNGTYAGIGGFANITGNFKMAKNVITIAAIDTGNNVAAYSSAGPMYDGRMAPQLAALGANGTSESAAIVSGACAKLQQMYKDAHSQKLPEASLIKAVLFCTADDIDSKGIDYRSGFGALNLIGAIECLQNNNYDSSSLLQGELWIKNLTLPPSATKFKVILTWTDTAGIVNNYKAITNDLDLELVEKATGKVYFPWCLNSFPNIDSLRQGATRKLDTLNTAELISIEMPPPGVYEIKVKAAHIETFKTRF